jgi:acyl-CoA thioester hydrolase
VNRRPLRRLKRDQPGLLRATVVVTVPFQDADPSGVAWHGNYFRYFDTARCALLDLLDYGYRAMAESGLVWPIVDTRVRYLASVAFGEVLEVTATLEEWEYRLRIGYEVHSRSGRRVTEAYTVQVPVDAATGEMRFGLPQAMHERLEQRIRAACHD